MAGWPPRADTSIPYAHEPSYCASAFPRGHFPSPLNGTPHSAISLSTSGSRTAQLTPSVDHNDQSWLSKAISTSGCLHAPGPRESYQPTSPYIQETDYILGTSERSWYNSASPPNPYLEDRNEFDCVPPGSLGSAKTQLYSSLAGDRFWKAPVQSSSSSSSLPNGGQPSSLPKVQRVQRTPPPPRPICTLRMTDSERWSSSHRNSQYDPSPMPHSAPVRLTHSAFPFASAPLAEPLDPNFVQDLVDSRHSAPVIAPAPLVSIGPGPGPPKSPIPSPISPSNSSQISKSSTVIFATMLKEKLLLPLKNLRRQSLDSTCVHTNHLFAEHVTTRDKIRHMFAQHWKKLCVMLAVAMFLFLIGNVVSMAVGGPSIYTS